MVGYDLGEQFSQISYANLRMETPDTIPLVTGTQQYNIPTLLCKKPEWNQWFFGREALRYMENEEGFLVDNLLQKACSEEPVEIGTGATKEPLYWLCF